MPQSGFLTSRQTVTKQQGHQDRSFVCDCLVEGDLNKTNENLEQTDHIV